MKVPIWYCNNNIDLVLPESADVALYDLPESRLSPLPAGHWLL